MQAVMSVIFIFFTGIIGIAGIVISKARYPINTIIFEKRANGFIIKKAKAGRSKNKASGVFEYVMKLPKFPMGERKRTKPQKFENIYMDVKGKPILFVYSDGKDQFVPLGMEFFGDMLESKIKVLDEDLCQFQVHSYRDADTRYKAKQDFWMKYGGVITIVVLAISILLIFYGSQYLYAGASNNYVESARILDRLTGALPGQVATPIGG